MKRSQSLAGAIFVAGLLACKGAGASDGFPQDIADHWHLPAVPPQDCLLCHETDEGGEGTVVRYFGLSMQDFGAVKKNKDLLLAALDTDQALDWDSDGDGVSDMQELLARTDPNDGPGPKVARFPAPQHGCATGGTPAPSSGWVGSLGLVLVGVMARLRRLRRMPRRGD